MSWRWIEEILLALLGYPSDIFKDKNLELSHQSLLSTESSKWSNISSIMMQRSHQSTNTTSVNDLETIGSFTSLIDREKSQNSNITFRLSSTISSIPTKSDFSFTSSYMPSQQMASCSINENVHSLSFSEKEWLQNVLFLAEKVKFLKSWIHDINELRRNIWIEGKDGK
jgi:hypothetical protein